MRWFDISQRKRGLERETDKGRPEQAETVRALRGFNIITILQAVVMTLLFAGPTDSFLRPTTPPDPLWVSLAFGEHLEIWDLAFPAVAIMILFSTVKLKLMTLSHGLSASVWGTLGGLWVAGSMLTEGPSYLFGAGLFALFIASQHISLVGIWRSEGVD